MVDTNHKNNNTSINCVVKNPLEPIKKFEELILEIKRNEVKREESKESFVEKSKREVVLFFSFDVVNSTLYKTINYFGWSKVISSLFSLLQEKVARKAASAELWRILGDEAIFIVKIKEFTDISNYINLFNTIFHSTINDLKSGEFFTKIGKSNKENELERLQNILSLKAAAWIALVNYDINALNEDEKLIENVFVEFKSRINNSQYQFYEFLGNDIDAGFRIAKYTQDRRLVVSFELAYLLSETTQELQKLNIITYKKLKGVWKDKLYPIIWYHDREELVQSFAYDELENNELINEYFENRSGESNSKIWNPEMYTDVSKALNKIAEDRNLKSKIMAIKNGILDSTDKPHTFINPLLELHCAAVCYKSSEKKILIARRSRERGPRHLRGCWEFGCAKANLYKNIADSIIEEYKNDFKIVLEPVLDMSRSDSQPIPLAVYQMEKDETKHKGIIFLAKITNEVNIDDFVPTSKHDKLRWISESEIKTFSEPCVPDFISTLEIAFKNIK